MKPRVPVHADQSGITWTALLVWVALLVAVAAVTLPNLVKARETTSMNTCLFNLMWMEHAKEQWAKDTSAATGTAISEQELARYLSRVEPKWDRNTVKGTSPARVHQCPLNGKHLVGPVGQRPRCTADDIVKQLRWDEAAYQSNYYPKR